MKIAILWATGHIAKWLISSFWSKKLYKLFLFSRSHTKIDEFLLIHNLTGTPLPYTEFPNHQYDVIINCIGIGTPSILQDSLYEQIKITEEYDDLILTYLLSNPGSRYIFLSSGAAYNTGFTEPVDDYSQAKYLLNTPEPSEYYGISKLYTEYKHRSLNHLFIVDIRLFSYFSRFIDLSAWFILSDIICAIKSNTVLKVSSDHMRRDYISHMELASLIESCIHSQDHINTAIDTYSRSPISKIEILDIFSRTYGFNYELISWPIRSPTWGKPNYYSQSHRAERYWYIPERSSAQILIDESKILLSLE